MPCAGISIERWKPWRRQSPAGPDSSKTGSITILTGNRCATIRGSRPWWPACTDRPRLPSRSLRELPRLRLRPQWRQCQASRTRGLPLVVAIIDRGTLGWMRQTALARVLGGESDANIGFQELRQLLLSFDFEERVK